MIDWCEIERLRLGIAAVCVLRGENWNCNKCKPPPSSSSSSYFPIRSPSDRVIRKNIFDDAFSRPLNGFFESGRLVVGAKMMTEPSDYKPIIVRFNYWPRLLHISPCYGMNETRLSTLLLTVPKPSRFAYFSKSSDSMSKMRASGRLNGAFQSLFPPHLIHIYKEIAGCVGWAMGEEEKKKKSSANGSRQKEESFSNAETSPKRLYTQTQLKQLLFAFLSLRSSRSRTPIWFRCIDMMAKNILR